jgi:nucleoside phosphorylase
MVDLVIVCALSDPELKAVLTLPWGWKSARPVDDVTFVHDGSLTDAAGRSISVIAAATSRMGMVSTALLGAKLIDMFRPRFIAMTGICAGTRGKANLGDAIVVDPSWDYQSGKRSEVNDSSSFAIGPHQLPLHLAVRSRFDQLKTDRAFLSSIRDGWPGAPDQVFKLLMGPVASGSAVLADGRVMNEIRQQHRELCGVEMEVYGLYAAAATAASPRPIAFAVKSVCDFGEADKNDSMQHYASYTSAAILCEFVKRFFSELNSC